MKLFKKFFGEFIKRIPGALIVSLIWLLLGWALSFVKQAVFFIPISFLTGNLLGIDEGAIIGGVVGKTILMLTFSSFFTTLVVTKGGFKVRLKAAVSGYVSAILDMIPYFKSFKDFPYKDKNARRLGIAGIGFGLLSYAFVSGDGSAINSFVCIIIFLKIAQEVVNQRGIITAVLNLISSRFGKKPISRKPTDYFVSGSGIGMLIGVIYAFVFGNQMLAYIIGACVFLWGFVGYQIERKNMQRLLKQAVATTAVVMIIVSQTIPFWAENTTYKNIDYWKEAVLCESLPVWAKNQNSWTIEKLEKDGVSIPINTDLSFEPYLNILLGKEDGELPTYSITLTDISEPLLDSTTGNYVLEASNQKITIRFSPQMGRDIKGSIRIQGTYKAYYKTSANDDVWEEAEEFIIDKTCEASFFEQVVDDFANGTVETEREFRVSGATREMMQELVMLDGSIRNEIFSIVYPSLCFEKFTNGKVHESTGTPLNYIGSATLVQESRNDYVITNTQKDGEPVALEEMQLGAHNYINILNGIENGELPKYSFEIHEYKQPFLKIYGLSDCLFSEFQGFR